MYVCFFKIIQFRTSCESSPTYILEFFLFGATTPLFASFWSLVCWCVFAHAFTAFKVWQRIRKSEKITTSRCELTFKTRSKRNAIKVLTRFERQRVYAWVTCVGTCWRPRVLRILCGCVRVWTDDNILTPLPRVERDVVFGEAEK